MVPCDAAVVSSLSELTSRIYPNIITINVKSTEWLCEQAILTPKNDKAAEISDIRGLFHGQFYVTSFRVIRARSLVILAP